MIRKIIKIDQKKCNGCGLCVEACHEGAIGLEDGKAKLLRDDYCDGLGDCLPVCPTGAISFIERETAAYDEKAVIQNKINKQKESSPCACPGSSPVFKSKEETESSFYQWPVQIKLVPVNAPYFQNTDLVIAADCTAYAYSDFHNKFLKNKAVIIGCPKLDSIDYTEKLTSILKNNEVKSLTIIRMEVPCCGGIENAAKTALKDSGKFIPWQVITISTDGKILN
ncbi:MAG: 4Fe-4S binding protein [Endomicrobiaceae bacterium]|nr:4Fe-4S binding protein [Endomicrobiaceae bacterium]